MPSRRPRYEEGIKLEQKTVFFGPFVGEMGWELLYWHGWVRKVSRTHFRDYRKIVASFPGREPFYPEADEYWSHPRKFVDVLKSSHGYVTDFWRNGQPSPDQVVVERKYGFIPRVRHSSLSLDSERPPDVEKAAEALLKTYAARLPEDTEFFVPWRRNRFEADGLEFGTSYPENPKSWKDFVQEAMPFGAQDFELLQPTSRGSALLAERVGPDARLLCVFPRNRRLRRPDKNWPREDYVKLLQQLQRRYPELTVAVLGAPGEAYFDDGVPSEWVDLINVPSDARLDMQVAALQQGALALGSMSGAILFALAAGCPAITWGWRGADVAYHEQNVLKTRFVYYPRMTAPVNHIFTLASGMIDGVLPPSHEDGRPWDPEGYDRMRFPGSGVLRRVRRLWAW